MNLWAVFLTGLLAGGASCAAAQGGLLAGAVARRPHPEAVGASPRSLVPPDGLGSGGDLPVAGFLAGKLVSHAALGAALGVLGSALQLSFRSRAGLQILAGAVMLVLAADLLGVRAVRRFVPRPPAVWGRLVRRSGRWGGALGPAVLGSATVLIPCGVTLSMEFLAVASGSALSGAAVMAAFVVGTTPLFAVIGYAARRSTTALRARLSGLLIDDVVEDLPGVTRSATDVAAGRTVVTPKVGAVVEPGVVVEAITELGYAARLNA